MTDSGEREALAAKRERNREERLAAVKRWVAYVKAHEPSEWGTQQNRLVDSQLESARNSGVDAAHRRRVERAGEEYRDDR